MEKQYIVDFVFPFFLQPHFSLKRQNMKKIELLLFDLGGVLVELGGMEIMHLWTQHRYNDEEMMEEWLKSPVVREYESGKCSTSDFVDTIIQSMKLPVQSDEFKEEFKSWPTRLYPGAEALLKTLKMQFPLATLSNTNEMHWPRIADTLNIKQLFEHHFPSHITGLIKPDEESFQQVFDHLKIRPENILFFDDNKLNIKAAKTLGIQAFQTRGFQELTTAIDSLGLIQTN